MCFDILAVEKIFYVQIRFAVKFDVKQIENFMHDFLREKQSNIGLATVYRSLELLREVGILTRLEFGDGCSRYEISPQDPKSHHHHHLVCLKCRKVFEFGDDLLEPLEADIVQKSGFKIVNHDLKFYGYCWECQQKP